eukprot:Skav212084  [mRNA]  locus=scaffold867:214040:221659:- [translate_table: standard]
MQRKPDGALHWLPQQSQKITVRRLAVASVIPSKMRCSWPLRSLMALLIVAVTRSSCFIGGAPTVGLRGSPSRVARAAVKLDIPMKESDLSQPKQIAMIFFFVLIFQEYFFGKGLFEQISGLFGLPLGDPSFVRERSRTTLTGPPELGTVQIAAGNFEAVRPLLKGQVD